MGKLTDAQTNEAWEDFKEFLISTGILRDVNAGENAYEKMKIESTHNIAQMAYKQGYVKGADLARSQEAQPAPIKIERRTITRKVGERSNRTIEQRNKDNEMLETVLQTQLFPLPLGDIIETMKQLGHKHWNNNNASAFVKLAIKDGYKIKKVGHGLYAYDSEVAK